MRRPAPTRSIKESATSPTMNTSPSFLYREQVLPRVPSFNASSRETRELRNAGTSPKIKLLANAVAAAKVSIGKLSVRETVREKCSGTKFLRNAKLASARKIPRTPPPNASNVLSVNNCRTMRRLFAPSAVRTAISRCLPAARDSNKLAILAHAMSRMNATEARSVSKPRRRSRV